MKTKPEIICKNCRRWYWLTGANQCKPRYEGSIEAMKAITGRVVDFEARGISAFGYGRPSTLNANNDCPFFAWRPTRWVLNLARKALFPNFKRKQSAQIGGKTCK